MIRPIAALMIPVSILLSGCASDDAQVSAEPERAAPRGGEPAGRLGVPVGTRIGDATVYDQAGNPVKLSSLYSAGPVVVTFYRGNWCPFCHEALKDWQGVLGEIEGEGATFVALTPERPSETVETIAKDHLTYRVYSDADREAARAFNVDFALAGDTVEKYKGYGIDLSSSNADGEWRLPHPGTFIVDSKGVVRYAHVDADYKKGRAEPGEVIAALRAM